MNEKSPSAPKAPSDRWTLCRLLGHFALICGVFLAIQYFLPTLAVRLLGRDFVLQHYLIIDLVPAYAVVLPLAWLLVRHIPRRDLPDRALSPVSLLGVFLVAFAALYLGSLVATGLSALVTYLTGWESTGSVEEVMESTGIWEDFLVTVVLAPMVEEFLFRKCLIDRLAPWGGKFAVVVSALMFGLYHGNVSQLIYAFPAGIVLGWVYCSTGRLTYSMILHTLINFFGSILPLMITENTGAMIVYSYLILGMLGSGIVLFFITRKNALAALPAPEKKAGGALLNPGTFLYLLLCLGMIVYSIMNGVL